MAELKGLTALVTGASSGIGAHFARQLAERGMNLVITARREERLEALAAELRKQHSVDVTVIATDLSTSEAAQALFEQTEGHGTSIDVLINNAGFGTHSDFADIAWEKSRQQLQLNITSLTELTWRFLSRMRERKRGWILNVASIGAYLPVPGYATYAAGKTYVRNFSEALAYEEARAGSSIKVCCLSPGGTATEFMEVAGQELASWQRGFLMTAERCARIGLSALFRGRRNIVAGMSNHLMMLTLRLLPRRLMAWLAAKVMG